MSAKVRQCFLSIWIGLSLSLAASAAEVGLTVSVESIAEQRNSSTNLYRANTCDLRIRFAGKIPENSMGILETRVIKAENNLKEDLLMPKSEPPHEWLRTYTEAHSRLGSRTVSQLQVRTSSRNATTLSIEGEADFFYPTAENGSLCVLTNFISDPDVWLSSPALRRAGLKLMFVGRENFHAFLKDWTEQKRGWYSSSGAITNPDKGKCALRFRIDGAGRRLARLEVENSTGKRHQPVSVMVTEHYRIIDLATPPPTDSRLVLYLDTPEARRTMPFKIEYVPLP